jgi:hypothetical protein
MHLKIPLANRGLKLSKSKLGYRGSAHPFVEYIPPIAFWHRAHPDMCFSSLLFQNWPIYCQKPRKPIGVWNCRATSGHRKTTIFSSIVHGFCQDAAVTGTSFSANAFCPFIHLTAWVFEVLLPLFSVKSRDPFRLVRRAWAKPRWAV